jgi:hypothetical protein
LSAEGLQLNYSQAGWGEENVFVSLNIPDLGEAVVEQIGYHQAETEAARVSADACCPSRFNQIEFASRAEDQAPLR